MEQINTLYLIHRGIDAHALFCVADRFLLENAHRGKGAHADGCDSDTPHGLKTGGFSVQCRSLRRDSPKGPPSPLNVSRRVLVSVENQAAGGADMGAPAQALGHACPTATTILAGVGRWHGYDSTASICCFAFEDGPK